MKNLKNLKGAKALSKSEQKSINGGECHVGCANNPCGRCPIGTIFNTNFCMCVISGIGGI